MLLVALLSVVLREKIHLANSLAKVNFSRM
jgi:hypothetical protein